jgi:hypothetical protein
MLVTALYMAALVCFTLAAINIPVKRLNLTALGLAFAVAPHILMHFI